MEKRRSFSSSLFIFCSLWLLAPMTLAHDIRLPVAADDLKMVFTGPDSPSVEFRFTEQEPLLVSLNPRLEDTAVLVYGTGVHGGSTGRIDLERDLWTPTQTGGYTYSDPSSSAIISSVVFEQATLTVIANPANWPWVPTGPVDELWFHFLIEQEWWCAQADEFTAQGENLADRIHFTNTTAPASCPSQVCGNAIHEIGELCDDGNLIEGDGCSNDCQSDACEVAEFDSTYEGIQNIIFDGVYDCTNEICHSPAMPPFNWPPQGGLDLTAEVSYDQLVGVVSSAASSDGVTLLDRVEPSEFVKSFLWEKLSAGTYGTPENVSPMPSVGPALTVEHLEAVQKWIRAGAPRDLVVPETAGLLGTCLPPDDPQKYYPPPELPAEGEGIQFRASAWPLPANSEDEVCFVTYYDFTNTDLVPEEDQVDCPGFGSANNPSGKCFYYDQRILRQDFQSHHSIISIYNGETSLVESDEFGNTTLSDAFGEFTFKPNYPNEVGAPSGSCDPLAIDPATGQNFDCSSTAVSGVACTGFGPTDAATDAPNFAGSQEPYSETNFAEGVYSILPMAGLILWNSHAFNLSDKDTTLGQYLDMYFGDSSDRRYQVRGIFDASKIFIQNVPPFKTREYCKTYTLPLNAHLFNLSSHTHRWGNRFRIWEPPQDICEPGGTGPLFCEEEEDCYCSPGDPSQLIYYSTEYTDPVQLNFETPRTFGRAERDRTFLFCSQYDNGSTPESPAVKRQSTSPDPPFFRFGGFPVTLGGPCPNEDSPYILPALGLTAQGVMCMDGPNQGEKCGAEPDPAAFCETSPGSNDGECDACSVLGGFTTEDEMFIMLGSFFIPEPSASLLAASALGTLAFVAARRRRQT